MTSQYGQPAADGSDRSMAILAHLAAPIATVISVGWLPFVGPLVLWFMCRDRSPFVRQAAAGAFNFAIGITAIWIVGWVLFITFIGIPIAILLWIAAAVMTLWCSIHGAIKANRGEAYHYPAQIKILS